MQYPSRSQRALARELDERGDELRKALDSVVDRVQLWRFATGRRRPEIKAQVAIEQATEGRVDGAGWVLDQELSEIRTALATESGPGEVETAEKPNGTDG